MPESIVQGNWGRNKQTPVQTTTPKAPAPAASAPSPIGGGLLHGASSGPAVPITNTPTFNANGSINYGTSNPKGVPQPKGTSNQLYFGNEEDKTSTKFQLDPLKATSGYDANGNVVTTESAPSVNHSTPTVQATETAPASFNPTGTTRSSNPSAVNTPAQAQTSPAQPAYGDYSTDQSAQGFREQDINPVGQDFFKSVGAHANYIKDQIAAFEKKTGTQVAFNSRAFQNQLKQSLGNQNSWDAIFKRFAHKPDYSTTINPSQSSADQTQAMLNQPIVSPEQTPQDKVATILNDQSDQTLHSQLNQILTMDPGTPGETLLRNILMLQLGAIDDPQINDYLDAQESRALQKYREGMAMVQTGNDEIDKAIDGALYDPTTSSGLMAKIAYQGERQQLASIENEKQYQQQKSDITLNDLRQKRADLEGYTKAKLYSMGAQDSSAGVALLGKIVSEADMQITLAQLDADHAQTTLNDQSRSVMADFTNTVSKIVMDNKDTESKLADDYDTTVSKIEDDRFTNERDKRKQTLDAYAGYIKDVNTLREKQKADERQALNDAYDRMSKLRDDAVKMSGLTGTIYVPGEDGQLTNTGIPTFDAKKYTDQSQQALMRLDISQSGENRQKANDLIDMYGSAAAPYVEQLMGLPSGALSGFQTKDELNRALDYLKESNSMTKFQVQNGLDANNGAILSNYKGGIKPAGIGIDPFSLPDVRQNISNLANVTQSFHKSGTGGSDPGGGHGGVDYVSKDGYSRAVRGGTVVKIVPWNGNSDFGNHVYVQDDTGLIWQYSHMGNRDVQGDNPFAVSVGDRVNPGDVLGREGNTGRVFSSKKGPLAGRHTDLRIVGKANASDLPTPVKTDNRTPEDRKKDETIITPEQRSWLANYVPSEILNTIPGIEHFGSGAVTYKDLKDQYVKAFKKYPPAADEKMLMEYGEEGLQMLLDSQKKPKKKIVSVSNE